MEVTTEELLEFHRTKYQTHDKELQKYIVDHEQELFGKVPQQIQVGDLIVDAEYYNNGVYEETEEVKQYLEFKKEHQRRFEEETKNIKGTNGPVQLNY